MFKKIAALCLLSSMLVGLASAVTLHAAGASFPYPLYLKWNKMFAENTKIKVNYQGIGSGGGQRQFIAGTTDFGGSDAAMSDKQINKAGGDVLHIPTVMGAVSIVYNVPGVSSLKLDGATLVDIFLGNIKKWNDSAIASLNPGVKLPDQAITVVHRSDGSGTTSIFTDYLAKQSLKWAADVGAGKAVAWPVGVGGKGNQGVSGAVKVNSGAIGYVSLAYAITNKMPTVALKNKAGYYVEPTVDSTSAAAAGALLSKKAKKKIAAADFRLNLNNAPGKKSYPIVGFTWLLVHQNQKNSTKGAALVKYLNWALSDGQNYAADLLYAPLPKAVRAEVLKVVADIKI